MNPYLEFIKEEAEDYVNLELNEEKEKEESQIKEWRCYDRFKFFKIIDVRAVSS